MEVACASMGPRPFSRGNALSLPEDLPHLLGFNGAATFQPRKHSIVTSTWAGEAGFNGAATFQPRKRRTSRPHRFCHAMLQWGRDLSAAETLRVRLIGSIPRCFNGAATFQPRKRGRLPGTGPLRRGFNGAATFQPRKQ